VALDGLRELGLGSGDVRARVSDRFLLSEILRDRGVPEGALGVVFSIVDKIERAPPEKVLERLAGPEVGIGREGARGILEVIRNPDLERLEDMFRDSEAVRARVERIRTFLGVMTDLGLSEFVEFDLSIVRGLAYYTGIVFEIFDRGGELRAICGGGRYDRLLEWAGGEPLSAAGFGMGDVVLGEVLLERELVPEYRRELDVFVVAVAEEQLPIGRRVGRAMREQGRSVVYPLRPQSVRKQFSAASAAGAREVVVIGPEEVDRGVAVVRDMATGEEREVPLERWVGQPLGAGTDQDRSGGVNPVGEGRPASG
jgi:histidyl-tRNA synthetase